MNITLTQSEILLILKKHLETKSMDVKLEDIQLYVAGADVVANAKNVDFKSPKAILIDGNRFSWNQENNITPLGVKTPDVQTTPDWSNTNQSKLSQESPKETPHSSIQIGAGKINMKDGNISITPSPTEQLVDTITTAIDFLNPYVTDSQKTMQALSQISKIGKQSFSKEDK